MDCLLCRADEAGLDLDAEDSATLQEALALSVGSPAAASPLASPHVAASHHAPQAASMPHVSASDEHPTASPPSSPGAAAAHPQPPHVTVSLPDAPDPSLHVPASPLDDSPKAAAQSLQQNTNTDFVHVKHPSAAAASSTAAGLGDSVTDTPKSGAGLPRFIPLSDADTPMSSDVTPGKPGLRGLDADNIASTEQQQQQQQQDTSKLGPEPFTSALPKPDEAGLTQHEGSCPPSGLPGHGTTTEPSSGMTHTANTEHAGLVQMHQPLASEATRVEVPLAAGPEARLSAELASATLLPAQAQGLPKTMLRCAWPCSCFIWFDLEHKHALIATGSQRLCVLPQAKYACLGRQEATAVHSDFLQHLSKHFD